MKNSVSTFAFLLQLKSTFTALVCAAILVSCLAQPYIKEGLKQHNSYRAKHNATALQLDNDLNRKAAECARYYAKKKKIDHSCSAKGKAGENIAALGDTRGCPSQSAAVKKAINEWYNEVKGYNYGDPGRSKGVTGHFTQLIWKASTKLGLASYQDKASKRTYTVALYSPQGNMESRYGGRFKHFKENVKKPKT